jgi:hypothetical protein
MTEPLGLGREDGATGAATALAVVLGVSSARSFPRIQKCLRAQLEHRSCRAYGRYYRDRWKLWWSDCCCCDRRSWNSRRMRWMKSSRAGGKDLTSQSDRQRRGSDEAYEVCRRRTCLARGHWSACQATVLGERDVCTWCSIED